MNGMDLTPRQSRWRIRPISPNNALYRPLFYIMHGDVRITKIGKWGGGTFVSVAHAMDAICFYLKGRDK